MQSVRCFCRQINRPYGLIVSRNYSIRAPVWLGGQKFVYDKQVEPRDGDPEGKPNFEEEMRARNPIDPDLDKAIDIGDLYTFQGVSRKKRLEQWKINRKSATLEQQARLHKLKIPLDEVKDDWVQEYGALQIKEVAEHYGVFEHLFGGAHFVPTQRMHISYDFDDEFVTPVHHGNNIPPEEAVTEPCVLYEAEPEALHTLIMTNPDGHLTDNEAEYLHWFVGNIPGGAVSEGQVLCDYLCPFPPRGTGFHRHIFVLFRQDKHIDYTQQQRSPNCTSLKGRTFHTMEFFREHQDELTPVALNFFQSEWDESVCDVYHKILNMREPAFEYMHPPWYRTPQTRYPRQQPFDRYFDRYRDKKDIAEEVMKMKLGMISPFKEHPPRPKYPLIHREQGYKPSWLKRREELMHRRLEQYKDLP